MRRLTLILVVVLGVGGAWIYHFHHERDRDPSTTTTTSSTTATSSSTTTTSTPATVTLAAVGDTELGNTPAVPSDPASFFAPIKSALAAPIVFGNLEGTMTSATTSKCGVPSPTCFAFRVPVAFAAVYRAAGFTVLNSANNHSDDFGPAGLTSTSDALRDAGIAQAGLPGQIALVREGSIRVAFVDFAPYTATNDLLNLPAATQLIARARRLANVVVVYMHAGAEGAQADHVTKATEYYVGENRGDPYAFAHAAIDEGADLVIASGPHVLRGMEFYRGHLIAYSLGDFVNDGNFALNGDLDLSAILHVTLSATGQFRSATFTSVVLRGAGVAYVDPTDASANFVNRLSRDDFGVDAALIGRDGAVTTRR